MGCKASKNFNTFSPIEHNFSPTNNPSYDAYFKKASELLKKTEALRQTMFVSKQKGVHLAGTSSYIESPYTKAVEVLFWALSAAKQGSIMKARVVITDTRSPYAVLNTQDYCRETLDLFKTLQEYLLILMETPESLSNFVKEIQQLKNEQIEIKKGLDPTAPNKEAKAVENNMKKLTDGITTSAKVLSQVQEEQDNARELIKFIQALMDTVDSVGAKASAMGLVRPAEIYKMVENDRKKQEKNNAKNNSTIPEKGNKNSAKIGNDMENADQNQRTEFGTIEENKDNKNNGHNHIIKAESVPIGHSAHNDNTKPHENQFGTGNLSQKGPEESQKNNNSVIHHNEHAHPPSFGEIKDGKVQPQGKLSFNPNQNEGNQLVNDPTSIYGHMQQMQSEGEKNKPNDSTVKVQAQSGKKKLYFVDDEFTHEVQEINDPKKVEGHGPGYLSPGGSKQAGILQGGENIKDAEEMRHALANESNAMKGFGEKARAYLQSKN